MARLKTVDEIKRDIKEAKDDIKYYDKIKKRYTMYVENERLLLAKLEELLVETQSLTNMKKLEQKDTLSASDRLFTAKLLIKLNGCGYYCDKGKTGHSLKLRYIPRGKKLMRQLEQLADKVKRMRSRSFYDTTIAKCERPIITRYVFFTT